MKKGKELKIATFKDYNVVYGSVNNKTPKALYVNISSWALPKSEYEVSYGRIIKDINKKIKQSIYNYIHNTLNSEFYKDRTIVDFDLKESGVRYGKKSFSNCEVTLFLKHETSVNSLVIKPILDDIANEIIRTSFESNRYFKFSKRKI